MNIYSFLSLLSYIGKEEDLCLSVSGCPSAYMWELYTKDELTATPVQFFKHSPRNNYI
jgi:hypothetical protein